MSSESQYCRGNVLWRRTYDRVLVLLPETGDLVSLTGSGRDLWAVLDEPGSVAELAERLAATFQAPAGRIADDIAPVIEELRRCGALAIVSKER